MFKDKIELKWRGKEYTTPVTMDLLDEIDEAFNIMDLVMETAKGKIKITRAARLISVVLIAGGCGASSEDVYKGMGGGRANLLSVMEMMGYIINKIYPHDDEDVKKKPKKVVKKTTRKTK